MKKLHGGGKQIKIVRIEESACGVKEKGENPKKANKIFKHLLQKEILCDKIVNNAQEQGRRETDTGKNS